MKKIFANLLGVVIFFLLSACCSIYIIREILSENTIRTIFNSTPEIFNVETENGISENIIDEMISTIEETDPILAKQFDRQKIEEEIILMISRSIQNLGNPKEKYLLNTTSLKKYIEEVITKYENETNKNIDDLVIDELLNNFDNEINITKDSIEIDEIIFIFEIIYSDKTIVSLISGIVLCILLIAILLGKIQPTLLIVKTPLMINGILTTLIGLFINNILPDTTTSGELFPEAIKQVILSPFYKVGIGCIVVSVLLIIIAKILKHNKSIENSNNAIENLGNVNYTPNDKYISNTPYNGYQNH